MTLVTKHFFASQNVLSVRSILKLQEECDFLFSGLDFASSIKRYSFYEGKKKKTP